MYYAIDVLMNHEIWIDQYEGIDIDKTLGNMIDIWIEKMRKKQLWRKGIAITGYKFEIPKSWNYTHSTVLTNIEIVNKRLFKKAMYKNQHKIEKRLAENKSYDGYIALTPSNFHDALNEFKTSGYPDIITLLTVLDIKIPYNEYYERVLAFDMDGD